MLRHRGRTYRGGVTGSPTRFHVRRLDTSRRDVRVRQLFDDVPKVQHEIIRAREGYVQQLAELRQSDDQRRWDVCQGVTLQIGVRPLAHMIGSASAVVKGHWGTAGHELREWNE